MTTQVHSAQGLDVSNFQGHYNWTKAKTDGTTFGIYRLTQGLGTPGTNSPDPAAVWNHGQLKTLGLHHGAYHFLNPLADGAAQGAYFVAQHKLLGLDQTDMLWLDNETAGTNPAATARCAAAFMRELDTLCPHNPRGVYTFISFAAEGNCAGLEHYPLWLAYPAAAAPKPPPPWTRWTFWQWGMRDGTDADAFNGTEVQLSAWLASFAPAPQPHASSYLHFTDGQHTLAQMAAGRHESLWSLLENAKRLATPTELAALERTLGNAMLAKGVPWRTVNP